MADAAQRMRALKLTDEEIRDTHGHGDGTWAMHDYNIADAQFDKIIKGMAEIVREHSRSNEWDEHNEIVSHLAWHLGKAAE